MKKIVKNQRIKYLLCIMVCMILLITGCGGKGSWQKQYDLGLKYLEKGNYEEAIVAFTAAIDIDPKNPLAFIGRGDAYMELGDSEENLKNAKENYRNALRLDETITEGWLGLTEVYILNGDYEKAADILNEALEKASDTEEIDTKLEAVKKEKKESSSSKNSKFRLKSSAQYYLEDGSIRYTYYEYDKKGNKIKETYYDQNNESNRYDTFEYDADGKKIRRNIYGYVGDEMYEGRVGEQWGYELSTYDENDNLIRKDVYIISGELYCHYDYEYDTEGKKIKEIHNNDIYKDTESVWGIYDYIYNDEGQLIKEEVFDTYDELWSYTTYEYDDNGNLARENSYRAYPASKLASYTLHEYEPNPARTDQA